MILLLFLSLTASLDIILDVDTAGIIENGLDIDDDLATFITLMHPDFNMLGITTTFGNAPIRKTFENAKFLTRFLNRTDIPVFEGKCWFNRIRGIESEASRWISGVLKDKSERSVGIIALGTLTNVAAVLKDLSVGRKIAWVLMMGGDLDREKYFHFDLNFMSDVYSARIVLMSNVPKIVIPIQTCIQVALDEIWMKELGSRCCIGDSLSDKAVCRYLGNIIPDFVLSTKYRLINSVFQNYPEASENIREGFIPWDLVSVLYLIKPELFEEESVYYMDISTLRTTSQKLEINDYWKEENFNSRVLVPTQVKSNQLKNELIHLLCNVPSDPNIKVIKLTTSLQKTLIILVPIVILIIFIALLYLMYLFIRTIF